MAVGQLALHETLEMHEILTFKTVCATKSSTMIGLVSDDDLRSLMRKDVDMNKQHIRDLQGMLSQGH